MKKLELLLGVILVLVSGIFYYMTFQLPEKSQIYPLFVITLLLILTLIHIVLTLKKEEDPNAKTGFEGFIPGQFFVVLIGSGLYVALINILGYFTSTVIYIISILIALRTDAKKSILISAGVTIGIYLVFKRILRVPLPTGFLV